MENKCLRVGGQAVIEGVMMRGNDMAATAVRLPSGEIEVDVKPAVSLADRYPILKKPLIRGVISLYESLALGLKALNYSAKSQGEDEEEQLSDRELFMTMAVAVVMAIVLFVMLPTAGAKFFHVLTDDPVVLNLLEGVLRLLIFVLYIVAISRMEGIYRVFQYHGAEHKTIHAYENGGPLTVENVQSFSTLHPRCGTAFLLIVMLVSIFVFAFLGWPDLITRILSRIVLMPVVAGVSYEIIRFAGRSKSALARIAILPGLMMQKLTTNQPNDDMVEVAIASLNAVLPDDERERMGLLKAGA